MSDGAGPFPMAAAPAARRYEVRIAGHLADRWAATLADGLTLTREADGTTTLRGPVPDQAALHGLLARIRDLGLELIAVVPAPDPLRSG